MAKSIVVQNVLVIVCGTSALASYGQQVLLSVDCATGNQDIVLIGNFHTERNLHYLNDMFD
jgi:hypothetical protein